ncbi:MAG: transglycosylase domain-containing protein [Culicoidibacterales bacterium]
MEANNMSKGSPQNKRATPKPTKKRRTKRIIWGIACVCFMFLLVGSITVGSFATIIFLDAKKDLPQINLEKIKTPNSSKVFDSADNLVADLAEDALIMVAYDELPTSLIDAFVAVEDARFFTHKGIDGPRTLSAILDSYVLRNGVSGGSTLTQQLVKNTLLADKIAENPEYRKSNKRKIDEWILAYDLEKEVPKKEIFTSYVNNAISYGRYSGVGTAAKRYFNKSVSELTLAESVLLAGIPQLPFENSPFTGINTATARYNMVIDSMVRHKFITTDEEKQLRNIPLADLVIRNQDEVLNPNAPYFSGIENELKEIFKEGTLDESGMPMYYKNYNIYTHLNQEQQAFANEIMNTDNYVDWEDAVDNTYGSNHTRTENLNFQGAFTVVQTKDGGVPAIGASRNFKETNGLNIAVEGFKSPGSAIKPIIDYAPAVDKFDWASRHIMNDKPTYYSGTRSQVFNYNQGGYKGFVTMQQAIADSTNTTAVQAMQQVGLEPAATMAGDLGLTRSKPLLEAGKLGESAALGGGLESTTKEMAGAYAAMGNAGKFNKPHIIRRIENNKGEIVYEYKPEQKQIMKESTAATMTESLIYTTKNGTPASSSRKQVNYEIAFASKTGTSSYSGDEISEYGLSTLAEKDHWIAGYSPEYAIAGWTGIAVEDGPALTRTKGNSNNNKGIGTYMTATWMNRFAPKGTSFDFLGAANRGRVGGIGSFEISNNHENSLVSWTTPALSYPSGMNDEDKAAFGTLVFDVTLNTSSGDISLEKGTTNLSASYQTYATQNGITGITVTARMSEQRAERVMPPVGGTIVARTKTKEVESTGLVPSRPPQTGPVGQN